MASDLGKKETPAPINRKRLRKDFRGQRAEFGSMASGLQMF